MDPVGAVLTLVLVCSAIYRTAAGKREALTAGLWTAALSAAIGAIIDPIDMALERVTGLASLAQPIGYSALVISSYLIAKLTYDILNIDSAWPIIFTVASLTGMCTIYFATELHHTQSLAIEAVPGTSSAWFAIAFAVGLLPTHISAIIGVLKIRHKENLLMWLLAVYGGVGAICPLLLVANHVGTANTVWPMSTLYPLIWVLSFISFGALALGGAISAYRDKQPAVVA